MQARITGLVLLLLAMTGGGASAQRVSLGPVDGEALAPTDTGRVKVGDVAPDFALRSFAGPVVSLSGFRGGRNVVLVFYRGHW